MTDTIHAIETSVPSVPCHPGDGATLCFAGEIDERSSEQGTGKLSILPVIGPGQVWIVEHPSGELHLAGLARRLLTAANVVIYDRALYAVVAANLPLGGYAEPAVLRDNPFDTPIERCLQFARDGWSVVWLADHTMPRGQRIERLVARMIAARCPASSSVALFVEPNGNVLRQTETELDRLAIVIDTMTSDDCLALAFAAVGPGAAAHLHAISSNGLAG